MIKVQRLYNDVLVNFLLVIVLKVLAVFWEYETFMSDITRFIWSFGFDCDNQYISHVTEW